MSVDFWLGLLIGIGVVVVALGLQYFWMYLKGPGG
jgi:hypothetical protein